METTYSFSIQPRSAKDLNGYRLKLYENGEEVGGGVFPNERGDEAGDDAAWDDAVEVATDWLDSRPIP